MSDPFNGRPDHTRRIDLHPMYRKPRFLEELHAIREEMSRECDYDVDLFAEMVRSGQRPHYGPVRNVRGLRTRAPAPELPDRKSHSGYGND